MDNTTSLQLADYIVIGLVLLYSAGVGFYYRFTGGKQKTAVEYFSANKSMKIVPLGLALMVSFVSAISLLGISGETYAHGTIFVVYYVGFLFSPLVVSYFYLPVFFQYENVSVYEYLEKRFGVKARLATSIVNYLQLTLYTGVILFAPSLAIEATIGLSSYKSILILGIICIFYTAIGGMKAVLVTDILQGVLMFVSILIVLFIVNNQLDGGLSSVWESAREGHRLDIFDFRMDPTIKHTWFTLITGSFFTFLSLYGVNQVETQRFKTVKTIGEARRALYLCTVLTAAIGSLTAYSGLVLYAVYKDCDPKTAGLISSYDKILPYFAATKMSVYPGIAGLFVAGVFCASLSTVSAMLNSLSAVFLEDYLKPLYPKFSKEFPEDKATLYGKIMAIINGLVIIGVAFLAGRFESLIILSMSIFGSISGPILGIFTLGLFFENSNENGAIIGMIIAVLTCLYASFGPKVPETPLPFSTNGCNFTLSSENANYSTLSIENNENEVPYINRISYMLYCAMGTLITIIVGYTASIIINKLQAKTNNNELDASLFTPFVASRIRRRRNREEGLKIEKIQSADQSIISDSRELNQLLK